MGAACASTPNEMAQGSSSTATCSSSVSEMITRSTGLVCAAEDEPFAIGGRLTAPDANPLLRLAVRRDAARCCGRGSLDFVLALRLSASEPPAPPPPDPLTAPPPPVPLAG